MLSYAKIKCSTFAMNSTLDYEQRNIRSVDQQFVEANVLIGHQFILFYDTASQILYPGKNSFYSYLTHNHRTDEVVIIGTSKTEISNLLKVIRDLLDN